MTREELEKVFEQRDAPTSFGFWESISRGVAKRLQEVDARDHYVKEALLTCCALQDVEASPDVDPQTGPSLDKYGEIALDMIERGVRYTSSIGADDGVPENVAEVYRLFNNEVKRHGPTRTKLNAIDHALDDIRDSLYNLEHNLKSAYDALDDAEDRLNKLY